MRYRLIESGEDFEGYKIVDDWNASMVVAVTVTREIDTASAAERRFAEWLVAAVNAAAKDSDPYRK